MAAEVGAPRVGGERKDDAKDGDDGEGDNDDEVGVGELLGAGSGHPFRGGEVSLGSAWFVRELIGVGGVWEKESSLQV